MQQSEEDFQEMSEAIDKGSRGCLILIILTISIICYAVFF